MALRRPNRFPGSEFSRRDRGLASRLRGIQESLSLSQSELANLIGVSLPTVQRWLKSETRPLLIAENRCWEIENLLKQAGEVLTPKGLRQWFHEPHPEFSGMSPILVLQTPGGIEKVLALLASIEWGLPA